jgi:sn-glycerol 3-phosphate transport system permease protein
MSLMKLLSRHGFLLIMTVLMLLPLYLAIVAASHDGSVMMTSVAPLTLGHHFFENLKMVLFHGMSTAGGTPVIWMMLNSAVMACSIAVGKIILALLSAFALVYFELPYKKMVFGFIFVTLLLPIEVRIIPTFQVIASFNWLNHYAGLTFPLFASATATFLFRQIFKSMPKELVDAAKLDGAGPLRFFWHILLPLSKTPIASLFIILFVYGWNQYLWPLVMTTDSTRATIVMGIRDMVGVADQVPEWHLIMMVSLLALLPPCIVILTMQRSFEKGLNT